MTRRRHGISRRIKRKAVRRAMLPNPRIENTFANGMRAIFEETNTAYMDFFESRLSSAARSDAKKVPSTRELKIAEFNRRLEAAKPKDWAGDYTEYNKIKAEEAAYLKTLKPDESATIHYTGPKDGVYGRAYYNEYYNKWTIARYKTEAARDRDAGPLEQKVSVVAGKVPSLEASVGRAPVVAPKLPALPNSRPAATFTKHSLELDALFAKVKLGANQRVIQLFNKMSGKLDIDNAKVISDLLGINVRNIGVSTVIDHFRDQTIRLVEDAGRAYAKQVRDIFESPDAHNLRVEELRKKLVERGDVSKSRADLIARDQVLKMNGKITATRQQRAGITKYEWSTSQDERVRDDHAALEGTIQDWDNPPVVDEKSGRREHPGQDFQCRCIAIPVISELDN